jgi:hypothetical protein
MSLPTDLVAIADVASHLNWDATQQAKYATEMARFISATTAVVERITGPVVQRSYDEWLDGGGQQVMLRSPVVSVTLLTESSGNAVQTLAEEPLTAAGDGYGYTINKTTGVVTRRASGSATTFADGVENIHAQYTAGLCADTPSVPANVALAALEIIRVNWQPQQSGNRPSMGQVDPNVADGLRMLGFFVPNRVMELLQPNITSFGIA